MTRRRQLCAEPGCSKPRAKPTDRIPGTGIKGSAFYCIEHEAAGIRRLATSFDRLRNQVALDPHDPANGGPNMDVRP